MEDLKHFKILENATVQVANLGYHLVDEGKEDDRVWVVAQKRPPPRIT